MSKRNKEAPKKLSHFRQQENNLNKHTILGMAMLETSMQEVGYAGPMVAAADGEIIDGSARHETAANVFGQEAEPIIVESDGKRPIVVVRTDIKDGKSKIARRLAAFANRTGQVNLEWDAPQLQALLAVDEKAFEGMFTLEELELPETPTKLVTMKIKQPPQMAWALIAIPLEQFGKVQALLDKLPRSAIVHTTANDKTG